MSDYPVCQCPDMDFHLTHTTVFEDRLVTCLGVGDNQEYVYRLVDKETGRHLRAYNGQYVFHDVSHARGQKTKFNKKYWRQEEAVIQRGLIKWSEDPV